MHGSSLILLMQQDDMQEDFIVRGLSNCSPVQAQIPSVCAKLHNLQTCSVVKAFFHAGLGLQQGSSSPV